MIDREAITTELAEIEHMLQDTPLSVDTRFALTGASQALRHTRDLASSLADILSA